MKDQLRPGQRIVNYAYLKKCIPECKSPEQISPLETWLWNLSEEEFKKVMKWSPNDE